MISSSSVLREQIAVQLQPAVLHGCSLITTFTAKCGMRTCIYTIDNGNTIVVNSLNTGINPKFQIYWGGRRRTTEKPKAPSRARRREGRVVGMVRPSQFGSPEACPCKYLSHANLHRRTNQGAGGCNPQTRAKRLFFGQKLNFSGRSQQPKMKNKIFFVFIKRENGIHSVERDKVPEIWDFSTNNYRVG